MKMTKTATVVVGITVLAAAAIVVKTSLRVKSAYFTPEIVQLRLVPSNVVVVRPTKFPHDTAKVCEIKDGVGGAVTRAVGRNVRLQDVIGEAWDCNPSRVVLPPETPKGGFDFLVTKAPDARKQLQTAVLKKLGYSAHEETRDTEVWVLKVENSGLSGLTVSPDNEKGGASVRDGKLLLTHQRLSIIMGGLSQGLNRPVVDKTGLDKFYNFSVPWTLEVQQKMQGGAFSLEGVKKVLGSLGITLEPDTQAQEMCVVEKAR
jgi:uncharacterized protein (TIGR03435 family)